MISTTLSQPNTTPGFLRVFASEKLSLGLVFPIAAYKGDMAVLEGQTELASVADVGGFAALWTRDIPIRDPNFGDLGQVLDPWVWMTYILPYVKNATLSTGSLILPLRHPIHLAKAATSLDVLSKGRLLLGLASGDRPIEFPAFGINLQDRGEYFREAFFYLDKLLNESFPHINSALGQLSGGDLVPKPQYGRLPIGVTGHSQQTLDWIAEYADYWITYPRAPHIQAQVVDDWQETVIRVGGTFKKPIAQSLYIDLADDPNTSPEPIHLGFYLGRYALIDLLLTLQSIGINHVTFNLKFSRRPVREVLDELIQDVVPLFPAHTTKYF